MNFAGTTTECETAQDINQSDADQISRIEDEVEEGREVAKELRR